jgi:shikimate kinase/3-dehydroquinate synthase
LSDESSVQRVVLIGPSGSGKSELATRLADRLGFTVIDVDASIVERIGMPISAFFERFGESAFRAIEREEVLKATRVPHVVIATGGGAVLAPENWAAWRPDAVVIGLTADPEVLVARVARQVDAEGEMADRPLLAGDATARIRDLLAARQSLYAQADGVIDTTSQTPDDDVSQAASLIESIADSGMTPTRSLLTPVGRSDIYVQRGARHALGAVIRQHWPFARRCWIISDGHVAPHWLNGVSATLQRDGLGVESLVVEPGESSKSLEDVQHLLVGMTGRGVTRRDVVIALGGGVVGDLAGFVASVCLRGLPLVQLPTSLLAMVDSSVGGKTGVNLPAGKNLAGAFYQPGVVLVDPDFLDTLPVEEYRSGMAEVIKHGFIQPSTPLGGSDLLEVLESSALQPIPSDIIVGVLARNVAIKHSVVQADERESGLRMILNYGHTAGHAIEADGYRYRHGEAVALGLVIVNRIARHMGRVDDAHVQRVEALIGAAGLPTRYEGHTETVLDRLSRDKKNVDGALHWVLPQEAGGVEVATGVAITVVRAAMVDIGAIDHANAL